MHHDCAVTAAGGGDLKKNTSEGFPEIIIVLFVFVCVCLCLFVFVCVCLCVCLWFVCVFVVVMFVFVTWAPRCAQPRHHAT